MSNNYGDEVFDAVCRIFNPYYKPKKGESNEQNQKIRRG